jgi:NADH-quinone oxidoreductase subunit L
VILVPLGVLAIGSLGAGFAFKEFFAGHEVEHFFRESLKQGHIIEECIMCRSSWRGCLQR